MKKSFWFQIIDNQGATCNGSFVSINWRDAAVPVKGSYTLPETWKSYFPQNLFVAICNSKSTTLEKFDERFSWIRES